MKALLFKGLSVALVGSCLMASRAVALMVPDADGDGMSDVWEGQHGFSITSGSTPAHQAPAADPDQDGWSNLEESEAGTDPNAADAPSGMLQPTILRHPEFESVMIVSWASLSGKQYTLLTSPDLGSGTWTAVDVPMMGTGEVIEVGMETLHADGSRPEKLFWRVTVSDVDSDGDNVSDWDELQLGLNPNLVDSDGDTLADGAEIQAGLNPKHPDTDLDGIRDNLDSAPLDNAALADRDGANLSQSLNEGLLGRWDFEGSGPAGTLLVSTPETVPPSKGAIDISGNGAFWDGLDVWPIAASGMPWKCLHLTGTAAHARLPMDRLITGSANSYRFNSRSQTWAMWINFERLAGSQPNTPGPLDTSTGRRTLFSIGMDETLSSNNPGSRPLVQCYFDGKGTANNSSDNRLVISTWQSGLETILTSWSVPANLDDGQWHHIAVRFIDQDGPTGRYHAWFDGGAFDPAQPSEHAGGTFDYTLNSAPHPWCYLGRFMKFLPNGGLGHEVLGARIDRLRVYLKPLTATDVAGLYNQDIDRDGLFDRTEARSRFWRDLNQDKIDQQSETTFPVDPFRWDAEDSDHDRDGLTSLQEQALLPLPTDPWKPDTDGDLLPDGWEVQYGLNPRSNTDQYSDSEPSSAGGPDGLTNLAEYMWGTNPKARDTDGDGTPDGQEVGPPGSSPPSHPNDPRDGGQPIPSDEKLTIKIAVGDESGSHSEDYVVECRRIDPETGAELHVYTVRSGGFGQFSNPAAGYSMFRKGDTHTFQLKWQGTKNTISASGSPNDGPDYDFTFRVEPQGDHGAILIDSWDKQNGAVDVGKPLQGTGLNNVATNEAEFRTKIEDRRVALAAIRLEWESVYSDASFIPHIDPWTSMENGKAWFADSPDPTIHEFRDVVAVRITGGLPNTAFWFRSFDVDDSTSDSWDFDDIALSALIDTNGPNGGDNSTRGSEVVGVPTYGRVLDPAGGVSYFGRFSGKLDSSGGMLMQMRVGTTPGNNYRAAVTLRSSEELELLHTDNGLDPQKLVTSVTAQNPGFEGAISPVLTIWRRLWVEIDTMTSDLSPPQGEENWIHGNVNSIGVGTPLPNGTPLFDCVFNGQIDRSFDEFDNGWLISASGSATSILDLIQWPTGEAVVRVNASPSGVGAYTLLDDDNSGLPSSLVPMLPRYSIDYEYLQEKFNLAFLKISDASEFNDSKEITFALNKSAGPPFSWNNESDLSDLDEHWVAHVVFGYQPNEGEDGDGSIIDEDGNLTNEPRTSGGTPQFLGISRGSLVYVETCRDAFSGMLTSSAPGAHEIGVELFTREIELLVAHEMGHMPGRFGDAMGELWNFHHDEEGIMTAGGNSGNDADFEPITIARFRRAERWNVGGED